MRGALPLCALLLAAAPAVRAESLKSRFQRRVGLLLELRARPPVPRAELERTIAAELGSGAADALLLGESHSDPGEFAAARAFVAAALASGRPAGGLLQEDALSNSFAADPLLAAAGVPFAEYPKVIEPGPPVRELFAAAPGAFLLSYTGHSHASERLRDLWLKDLEMERIPGWPRRRRVVFTAAEAVRAAGKRPLVVAMIREDGPLVAAQSLFLRELPGGRGEKLEKLIAELDKLVALWRERFAAAPARPAGLFFVRDAHAERTWYGLTPADAVPRKLLAARAALRSPETAAFAGGRRLSGLEAQPESGPEGDGIRVTLTAEDGRVLARLMTTTEEEVLP